MKDPLSTDERACRYQRTVDSYHFSMCGKPAKFIVTTASGQRLARCGIHVKRYRVRMFRGDTGIKSVEAL